MRETSVLYQDPDVPLREPLDFEYRLNRKAAKQIYNSEKQDKIKQHKL